MLPDLNMLETLNVLLSEGSVVRAAKRLQLSPSAMSRALARLREATGDPLLVRAGRGLVATPRALEMAPRVRALVRDAEAVLRPTESIDPAKLVRTFTLRSSDGFVESFGPDLVRRISEEAPGVQLHFLRKHDRTSDGLRDGTIDLETGVIGKSLGPEVRTRTLFRDRFVGVVAPEHPMAQGEITVQRYAAGRHVRVSQHAVSRGHFDEALAEVGLARTIVASVDGYSAALALVRGSDLIASVPERHTGTLRAGLMSFPLPFPVPELTISLLWHPRLDGDQAHRWLRQCVLACCAE